MIKKVNWPQAFVEVILLLLGAGLAIGADGWNDRRLDRIAEREYLTSLYGDFEETREQFMGAISRTEEIRDLDLRLLRWLSRSQEEIPIDSILEKGLASVLRIPVLSGDGDLSRFGELGASEFVAERQPEDRVG